MIDDLQALDKARFMVSALPFGLGKLANRVPRLPDTLHRAVASTVSAEERAGQHHDPLRYAPAILLPWPTGCY